jgi:hypothetical protein
MNNPMEEMLKIVQAHEMRIDYNFNAMLHLSMLLEYLYDALEKLDIKIDMEPFEEYQAKKLKEIESSYEEIKNDPEAQEKLKKVFEESGIGADLNLSDD